MKPYFNYTLVVIFSLMATFLFPQDASARSPLRYEPRVEIRAGLSGYPVICDIVTDNFGFWRKNYETVSGGDILQGLYADYKGELKSMGSFHVAAGYRLKGWLTLSGYFMYNQMWQDVLSGTSGKIVDTRWSHVMAVTPEVKFTFLNKRYVQLYGSLAAGLSFYKSDDDSFMDYDVYPHVQVVPFGISTGRRFFGFTEVGYGTEFIGLRAGLGIRF